MSNDEQHVWRRWEDALARSSSSTSRQAPTSRCEHGLWLCAHVLSACGLAFALGWAAHRDGLLSPYLLVDSLVLVCTLVRAALRLRALVVGTGKAINGAFERAHTHEQIL